MNAKWIFVLLIVPIGILFFLGLYIRQGVTTDCSVNRKCNSGSQRDISHTLSADFIKPVNPVASPSSNLLTIVSSAQDAYPTVFAEYKMFFESDLKAIEASSMARPGFLAGRIDSFTKKGAESRTVDVLIGRRDTQHGNRPVYSNIVQYTDAEVQEGKSRNAAARLAVLHYFITSSVGGTPYEQTEIMRLFMRWWYAGPYSELTDDAIIGLYEFVAKDLIRHPLVREYAASNLPAGRRPDMTELMLDILQDNTIGDERVHGPIIERACSYLREAECINLLQSVLSDPATPVSPWKAKIIRHAAGLPFKESEKDASMSKEVEISL